MKKLNKGVLLCIGLLPCVLATTSCNDGQRVKENDYYFDVTDSSKKLVKYVGKENELVIPDGCTEIAEGAFLNVDNLKSVTLSDSITSIDDKAFAECDNLESISFSANLESIGDEAFSKCAKLHDLVLPNSVTKIGTRAFYDCDAITSINVPDSVTSLGDGVFYNCSNLESATLGTGVTGINDQAFAFCNLKTLDIKGELKSIGYQGLVGNEKLSFSIPNSVESIGAWSLCSKKYENGLVIPDSVKEIGVGAFAGCDIRGSLVIPRSVQKIEATTFNENYNLRKVYLYRKGQLEVNTKDNDNFMKATWYYFTYNGSKENGVGNWWYYDTDGSIKEKVITLTDMLGQ